MTYDFRVAARKKKPKSNPKLKHMSKGDLYRAAEKAAHEGKDPGEYLDELQVRDLEMLKRVDELTFRGEDKDEDEE